MSNTRSNQPKKENPIFPKPLTLKRCDDADIRERLQSGLAFFSTPRTRNAKNSPTTILFNQNLTTYPVQRKDDSHVVRTILNLAGIDQTETHYLEQRTEDRRRNPS